MVGDPPADLSVTVRFRRGGKEPKDEARTLVLGSPIEGGGRYGRLADGDAVFRLPDHLLNGADVVPLHDLLQGRWSKASAEAPPPEAPPKEDGNPK